MRKHLLSFFLLVISLVCRAHDGENFVASDLFASLQPGDKAALLMVHFGTTHDDTRALTIDAINQKAKEAFKAKFGRSPKVYDVVIGDGSRRLE